MSIRDARFVLGLVFVVTACGGFPRPYTSVDLQRDSHDRAGEALVHYLTQSGADSAACAPASRILVRFTVHDFVRFVRGLERGDVPPGRWTACARRLLGGLRGYGLQQAVTELAVRFEKNLDATDDDAPRLSIMNALGVALDARPSGSSAPPAAAKKIADELAGRELGSHARAIAAYVYDGLEMSRGRYRGTIVTEDALATITDAPVLQRLARHLPTQSVRDAARARFVDVAIAASSNSWIRKHAEETRARVLASGRNALDLVKFRMLNASYGGGPPDGKVVVEQNVGAQSARLLFELMEETSLVPTLDLREGTHFTLSGVDVPVRLCGPAEALDITPCVESAALGVASRLAAVDADGVLHVRDEVSTVELRSLFARGSELAVPVSLDATRLTEVRWPVRVLPPEPILYEHGEPLTATVEKLGPRIAVNFGTNGRATSLAFVEESDLSAFSITTRGAAGRSGTPGMSGSSGMSGSNGSSASCPSTDGGNGGDGGRGGDGSDGGDGGPGGDGGDVDITLVCDADCDELERIARTLLRTEGGPGGAGGGGGDGGRGGSGGQGGMGTTCTVSSFGSSSHSASSSQTTHLSSGSRGNDGPDGSRGSDGRPGRPGKPGRIEIHVLQRAVHLPRPA